MQEERIFQPQDAYGLGDWKQHESEEEENEEKNWVKQKNEEGDDKEAEAITTTTPGTGTGGGGEGDGWIPPPPSKIVTRVIAPVAAAKLGRMSKMERQWEKQQQQRHLPPPSSSSSFAQGAIRGVIQQRWPTTATMPLSSETQPEKCEGSTSTSSRKKKKKKKREQQEEEPPSSHHHHGAGVVDTSSFDRHGGLFNKLMEAQLVENQVLVLQAFRFFTTSNFFEKS